jgi:hypothetical protein
MKSTPLLLLILASLFVANFSFAQGRTLGAQEIVLDNGSGGKLTIKYNGTGHDTIYFGNGGFSGGGSMPAGSNSQTLRHDGTTFVADSNLLNDGQQVRFSGGVRYAVRSISGADSLLETDHIVIADMSENEYPVKMPIPTAGRQITIRRVGNCGECEGNWLLIQPNDGELIDGWTDYSLAPWEMAATFISDGTDWYPVSLLGGFFF